MSRKGVRLPASTSRMAAAFSFSSPPLRSESLAGARPASAGVTSNTSMRPFFSSATSVAPVVVSSSSPSWPCTTHTCSAPRFFSTRAIGSTQCQENTPTTWRLTPPGLEIGPSRLKMVRMPSSPRMGGPVLHGRVVLRRPQEAEARIRDAARDGVERHVELDAELREHVGGAGPGRDAPVAVLGDFDSRAGDLIA